MQQKLRFRVLEKKKFQMIFWNYNFTCVIDKNVSETVSNVHDDSSLWLPDIPIDLSKRMFSCVKIKNEIRQ